MAWQPASVVFADTASNFVVYLRGRLDPSLMVGLDLSRWKRPAEAVHITPISTRSDGIIERLRLQVDVYAEEWDRCFDITAEVRLAMAVAALTLPDVKHVKEETAMRNLPEPEGPRVLSDFTVTVVGAETP